MVDPMVITRPSAGVLDCDSRTVFVLKLTMYMTKIKIDICPNVVACMLYHRFLCYKVNVAPLCYVSFERTGQAKQGILSSGPLRHDIASKTRQHTVRIHVQRMPPSFTCPSEHLYGDGELRGTLTLLVKGLAALLLVVLALDLL